MSLWHTIKGRTMLHDYPCTPEGCDGGLDGIIHFCVSEDTPACEIEDTCPLRPVYLEHQAMRAVVDAVIAVRSNHGLKRAIRQLRFTATTQPASHYRATCDTLADKLEALL